MDQFLTRSYIRLVLMGRQAELGELQRLVRSAG
jgi:hypothetical protein